MTVTLRGVLSVLAAGLAVEAFGSAYLLIGGGYSFEAAGVILGLGPLLALTGVLTLWAGRRMWHRVSGGSLRASDVTFGLSLVAILTALGLLGGYAYEGASVLPTVPLWGLGLAVWASLWLTFATFALIARSYTGPRGRVAIGLGLGWAAVITSWIAWTLAQENGPILQAIETHSMRVGVLVAPLIGLTNYLFPAYVLLCIGYLGAIRRLSVIGVQGSSPLTPTLAAAV